jgi:hypothetical protein
MIPLNLGYASTWRQRYFVSGHALAPNNLMPLGFANLGIVMIGLIVLWTGYRKNKRWAWFVMLIILLLCFFPSSALPMFLHIRADAIAANHSSQKASIPIDFVFSCRVDRLRLSWCRRRHARGIVSAKEDIYAISNPCANAAPIVARGCISDCDQLLYGPKQQYRANEVSHIWSERIVNKGSRPRQPAKRSKVRMVCAAGKESG